MSLYDTDTDKGTWTFNQYTQNRDEIEIENNDICKCNDKHATCTSVQSLSFILTLNIENVAKRYRLVPINMCIESYMNYNKNMHSPSPTPTQEASSPTTPFPCKSWVSLI